MPDQSLDLAGLIIDMTKQVARLAGDVEGMEKSTRENRKETREELSRLRESVEALKSAMDKDGATTLERRQGLNRRLAAIDESISALDKRLKVVEATDQSVKTLITTGDRLGVWKYVLAAIAAAVLAGGGYAIAQAGGGS